MADYWIVTGKRPFEHASLEAAEQERGRLIKEEPDRRWRVIRCKRFLKSSSHYRQLEAVLKDILRDGLTPAHQARTTELLALAHDRQASAAELEKQAA